MHILLKLKLHCSIFLPPIEDTVIFDYPEDMVADISESSVSFNCSASGVPLPDISWFKDGSLLDPNTNNITHTTTDASISSVLEISPLLLSDAGVYICNASGYDDTAAREFTFTLESKHNTVLSFSVLHVCVCIIMQVLQPSFFTQMTPPPVQETVSPSPAQHLAFLCPSSPGQEMVLL